MSGPPDETPERALVIGYGNPYRRDDGVAWHVLNMLRERWGRPPLPQDATGEDDLGHTVDTVMAHQILPETAPLLAGYDRVVFIDAHAGAIPEAVRVLPVQEETTFQAVVHHMTPGLLLHTARLHTDRLPAAWLVSVRGYDFDFGDDLSAPCRSHSETAAAEVLRCVSPAG